MRKAAVAASIAGVVLFTACDMLDDDGGGLVRGLAWREAYMSVGGSYYSVPHGMVLTEIDDSFDLVNGGGVFDAGSHPFEGFGFSRWASGDAEGGTRVFGTLDEPVWITSETWWHGVRLPESRPTFLLGVTTMPLTGVFDGTGTFEGKPIPAAASPAFALVWGGSIGVVAPVGADQFHLSFYDGFTLDEGTFAVPGDIAVECGWVLTSAIPPSVDSGTINITSYTASSFAGTFDLTIGAETISGSFDVPTALYGKTPPPDSYEDDDTWDAAKPIVVGGDPQARTIDFMKDDDWLAVAAAAGTTYCVRTFAHAFDRKLPVYFDADGMTEWDEDSNVWLRAYDIDGVTPLTPEWAPGRMVFTAPSSGTCFVRVGGIPGSYAVEALYQTGVSADAFEAAGDDSFADAEAITVDAPAQPHTFHTFTDEDWVSFAATSGGEYYIRTTGAAPAPRVTLYDTDGTTDLEEDWGEVAWVAPADGTYFVRVAGEPGTYGLEISTSSGVAPDAHEPDDVWTQAVAIVPDGASQSRTHHSLLDEDWFAVDAIAGTTYYPDIAPADGTVVSLAWYDTDGTTQLVFGGGFDCVVSGTYYMKISMGTYLGGVGPYTISVVTHVDHTLPDAYEPDNGPAEATPFVLGGPPQGHTLHSSSDRDWVAVDVPTGGMTITADVLSDPALLGFADVRIFDIDGVTELASGLDGAACVAAAPGTYYVVVLMYTSWYYIDIEVQ